MRVARRSSVTASGSAGAARRRDSPVATWAAAAGDVAGREVSSRSSSRRARIRRRAGRAGERGDRLAGQAGDPARRRQLPEGGAEREAPQAGPVRVGPDHRFGKRRPEDVERHQLARGEARPQVPEEPSRPMRAGSARDPSSAATRPASSATAAAIAASSGGAAPSRTAATICQRASASAGAAIPARGPGPGMSAVRAEGARDAGVGAGQAGRRAPADPAVRQARPLPARRSEPPRDRPLPLAAPGRRAGRPRAAAEACRRGVRRRPDARRPS